MLKSGNSKQVWQKKTVAFARTHEAVPFEMQNKFSPNYHKCIFFYPTNKSYMTKRFTWVSTSDFSAVTSSEGFVELWLSCISEPLLLAYTKYGCR